MRMRFSAALATGALLVAPALCMAQAAPATAIPPAISVTLSYHEDNSGTFRVMSDKTTAVTNIQDGDVLKPGWTVVTGVGDLAELKINHTGTIIKIAQNTNFTIEGLRTETGGQDVFSLGVGKARTVAGKASGKDVYQIRTQSAVCGVRGSDIVVEYLEGTTSKLYTLEGMGWIQDTASGKQLDVPQGDFADALAPSFQASPIPQDVLSGLQKEMNFVKLDPAEAMAIEKASQEEEQSQQPAQNPPPPPSAGQSSFMDGVLMALRNVMGFEIGSVMIDGQIYGMVIVEPTFTIGKLRIGLDLPIMYHNNMLDPGDWYHPQGNDEWSFGTDQGADPDRVAADFFRDALLKLKYIEFGRQRDPFFFKLGNLEDVTIGHGLIMRDFANDADFPTVRRVGVNIGADFGSGGFEAMVNDAAPSIIDGTVYPPDILGGRLYVRPIPGFRGALGFSAIVDLNPARDFYDPITGAIGPAAAGNPIFFNPGMDLDLPFVESDAFGLVFFTDGAVMLPYFRSTTPFYSWISQGFATQAVWSPSASIPLKNWGLATGFLGNLIIPDFTWRIEYRYFTGTFQPQLYDSGYERSRSSYVLNVLSYLQNTSNPLYNNYNMGIYTEGAFKLNKVFSVRVGYFWPWTINQSTGSWGPDPNNPDHFIASFQLEKGVIPVVNLWGSISYERTSLFSGNSVPANLNDALFNANTDITAQVNYPVSPIMDLSLLYTITPVLNPDGTLHYSSGNTLPDMATTVSITTSIHL
ncbi:MAG: hypothetical protein ABSG38_05500 [Spirochaetia bacterium]